MGSDPLGFSSIEHLHTSFSQVSCYLRCPQQFKFRYVLGAKPSHRAAELVFGSCIHGALAWYHQELQRTGSKPSMCLVHDEFANLWAVAQQGPLPILWADHDSIGALEKQAVELLQRYVDQHAVRRILAVEQGFTLPIVDPRTGRQQEEQLDGFVDVVEEDLDGRVWITELKTASRAFDDARLAYDHQPTIYLMARDSLGVANAGVRFRVLRKGKKPVIDTHELSRGPAQHAETVDVVLQVLRAIDHRIFYRQRGWQCTGCPHRADCGA